MSECEVETNSIPSELTPAQRKPPFYSQQDFNDTISEIHSLDTATLTSSMSGRRQYSGSLRHCHSKSERMRTDRAATEVAITHGSY
jgi:hypothetical protein